jgi:hypothetical protein
MIVHSEITAVDRYLANGYLDVLGMSSRFAAAIAAATMRIQSETGVAGHFAEIGTFEGRFFIALAHALQRGERAIGVDHFEWPDIGVIDRFKRNLSHYGPKDDRAIVLKADSRLLTRAQLLDGAEGSVRFFHIDGEHTADHLSKDRPRPLRARSSRHPVPRRHAPPGLPDAGPDRGRVSERASRDAGVLCDRS